MYPIIQRDSALLPYAGDIGHAPLSAFVPGRSGPALCLGLPPRTAMVLRPVE